MPSLASFQLTPPQDSREFEQMLRDYCNNVFPGMACLFARPGQKQYGVDVISPGPKGIVAIQCKDYQDTCGTNTIIDIKAQGSENFIPELENKIGVAFSSPPYYNLEDYRIGNQSWTDGVSYEEWRNGYLKDTISNIYRYLIDDGYFAININNFNKYNDYNLVGDTVKIAQEIGFELEDIHTLKNIKRCHGHVQWDGECGWNDNDEKIFVFKKKTN